jgi:uncharacterized membrane protein (UPF0127 family)
MSKNDGMFFTFDGPAQRHGMWMKNMKIPLDIIWLSEDMSIVYINYDVPVCSDNGPCPTVSSVYKSKYAIELNAGTALRLALKRGDVLRVSKAPAI